MARWRNMALHWKALLLAAAAVIAGGTAFAITQHLPLPLGWYWGLTTAATVGYGDIVPQDNSGRVIAAVMMIIAIPSLGTAYAMFTSHHVSKRVHADNKRTVERLEADNKRLHTVVHDTYYHLTGTQHPHDQRTPDQLPARPTPAGGHTGTGSSRAVPADKERPGEGS